ncbi:MAG: carbon monoxide dehydrogenase subunit G, partial [Alphaproteobacteria bacterium]|nr:carbon monoxide dehydrogenase subunit G [Alphaproteobacteria bacterium]
MELSGEHLIPAPRARVWQALNDPAVLKAALPGCEELVKVTDREYAGRMRVALGAIDVVLRGRLLLGDLDPPRGCVLSAEGQGGAAGWARGSARIGLTEEGDKTRLSWHGTAEVGGKLA